jgi:DNA polymerase I-like protein with 3'-5' exonuclease and polymerase domains
MNNYLVIDTESTGATNETYGSALCPANRLCYVGLRTPTHSRELEIEYAADQPYGEELALVQQYIDDCELIVFFNAKHDLHWLRRYGIDYSKKPIWDVQLADFILSCQKNPMPALNDVAEAMGWEPKIDTVKTEYWEKGIDTDGVPQDLLIEYLNYDTRLTEAGYLTQRKILGSTKQARLIWNCCQDELVTCQMEWNGLKYDLEYSLQIAREIEGEIIEIDKKLYNFFPYSYVSWTSPAQVSAMLYGGTIKYSVQEDTGTIFKSGKREGQARFKWVDKEQQFPRLVEPPKNSELAIVGRFSTNDKTLKRAKSQGTSKKIIQLVLDRRGLQTQIDRYFRGLPRVYQEQQWVDSIIHSSLHHCVAETGRLSSSNPNTQNLDRESVLRKCIISRFFIESKNFDL